MKLRLNEQPKLKYTLFVDGKESFSIDDLPDTWTIKNDLNLQLLQKIFGASEAEDHQDYFLNMDLHWRGTTDPLYPYQTTTRIGEKLKLSVMDSADQPKFTLQFLLLKNFLKIGAAKRRIVRS